jgi:hypothetical protein
MFLGGEETAQSGYSPRCARRRRPPGPPSTRFADHLTKIAPSRACLDDPWQADRPQRTISLRCSEYCPDVDLLHLGELDGTGALTASLDEQTAAQKRVFSTAVQLNMTAIALAGLRSDRLAQLLP